MISKDIAFKGFNFQKGEVMISKDIAFKGFNFQKGDLK